MCSLTIMKIPYTRSWILASSVAGLSVAQASVISANFREDNGNPNQLIAPTTVAGGGAGVGATNWNDALGGTGSAADLVDDSGAGTTLDLSWSSGGMWGDGTANTDADAQVGNAQLQRGYLDDNQGAPDPIVISISEVPYAQYDLVVYFSTDTSGDSYGTISVTDAIGTKTGSTSGTKLLWGESSVLDDTNSLRITGLSGNATIDAPVRSGAIRHSVSGIQIIEVPEPATITLAGFAGMLLLGRRRRS